MEYIILTSAFPKGKENTIIARSKGKPVASANSTFQTALIDGFVKNQTADDSANISIFNMPNIGAFPFNYTCPYYKGHPYKQGFLDVKDQSFINIVCIKHWFKYCKTKSILKKCLKNKHDVVVICYDLYTPWLRAIFELKDRYNFKALVVVPDLPNLTGTPETLIYKLYNALPSTDISKYIKSFDGFVLLAEKMAEFLNVSNKPHIVLEGIYRSSIMNNDNHATHNENKEFTILYAGALSKRNSVDKLIQAIEEIQDENIKLELFGSGELVPYIKACCESNERIVYRGQVSHNELLEELSKADLLVNPREPDKEFASYSFPSKTMEYMASGTPVLMYKLPTLPVEYEDFIYFIDEKTDALNAIKKAIISILQMNPYDRSKKGMAARKFILENKNSRFRLKEF